MAEAFIIETMRFAYNHFLDILIILLGLILLTSSIMVSDVTSRHGGENIFENKKKKNIFNEMLLLK